jgi:competence protein ComEC
MDLASIIPGNRARVLLPAAVLLAFATAGMARGQDLGTFSLTCLEIPDYGHGAGLAVVIRTPGGKTFLYDTGSGYPGKGSQAWSGDYNAGRDTVLPYLKSRGIDRIDGVLISHAHYDHFGGLLWLADHAEIPKLSDSGYIFPGKPDGELVAYDRLRERFRKAPGAYLAAHSGDRLALDDRIDVEVLAPATSRRSTKMSCC